MAAFSATAPGCLVAGDCPAVDVYTNRAVEPEDASEAAARIEAIRHGGTFVADNGGTAPLAVETTEIVALEEVERGYCGDTELHGHVADVVAVVDVQGEFTIELPARAGVTADGAAALELEGGRHRIDTDELADRVMVPENMVAIGVEVATDCLGDTVALGLWIGPRDCTDGGTCPTERVEPLGTLPHFVAPQIGDHVGECV
jgi:hypothetical protein